VRLAYFGTSDFAAGLLRRLAAEPDHRPALVVTPPDRGRGRGRRVTPAPAAAAAEELEIPVLRTEATEEAGSLERIRGAGADLGIVCAFGQLLREPLLSELEMLNVHPSLLPRWRGAAPIERAIMVGDAETGVSIMRVTAGLDSGPVALQEAVAIGDADYGSLAARLEEIAARLLAEALGRRERGELELTDQDDEAATYAEKIEPGERRLDPARPALELERRVRALNPHIGTHLELADGERLGILAARAEPGGLAPGSFDDSAGLRLGCGEGVLRLLRVRPAGGKVMAADAYLRGHPLPGS
jgi:methionyl-tRNA formyltransferase